MRTVRLEHRAARALDRAKADFDRFDEVYRALEWLLANNPRQGRCLGGAARVCLQEAILAKTPSVLAVFTYTDDEVLIYDLKAVPRSED